MSQAQHVLDASALLTALQGEQGEALVADKLERSAISAVNWSEVLQKAMSSGIDTEGLRGDLEMLGLNIMPFGLEEAELAAALWPHTKPLGLSLGDRACLALASRLGLPAITADQSWRELEIGVEIQLVR